MAIDFKGAHFPKDIILMGVRSVKLNKRTKTVIEFLRSD